MRLQTFNAMSIQLKRIYEAPSGSDGTRILIERLWPRGLSKVKAKVDVWLKDLAPSSSLRKWFNHDPARWREFRSRYFKELEQRHEELTTLIEHVKSGAVTFVFASREERFNNATALKQYVERLRWKMPTG